jgi:hypothetical protein
MRKAVFITATLCIFGGNVSTAKAHFLWHHKHMTLDRKIKYFQRSIHHDATSLKWLDEAKRNRNHELALYSIQHDIQKLIVWHKEALRWHKNQLKRYQQRWEQLHPPAAPTYIFSNSAWLCIHQYEGSWNDPDPPYYGGLQMDMEFMRSYGSELLKTKGTADHWTPEEQMAVAEKARLSGRGYYPWPNTARSCGLI